MSTIDLHLHSTASDGQLSPAEVVRQAAKLGLALIALSDHDTTDGIAPALAAARDFPELTVIPAIELSTEIDDGEAHILGYFIDIGSQELEARLGRLRNSRRERAQKIITRLASLGVNIRWERVQEIAGDGSVGRPHLAQALQEKGYVSDAREAFTRYIGRGGPAYVEREKITPAEAVRIILAARGLPVLAHPFTVNDPEALIAELKPVGLAGVEAYYFGYSNEEISRLVSLAERYGLIATGGSDFHGPNSSVEATMGGAPVPDEVGEQLFALARQWGLKIP